MQGGSFQTAQYVTGVAPLVYSVDPTSPTSLATLNQGGVNLNTSTGTLSAPGSVTATAYQIRLRATDPGNLFGTSPVFTLQVVQAASFVWNTAALQALVDPTVTSGDLVGVPIFDFYENDVGFSIDISQYVSGVPALVQINRQPSEEFALSVITYNEGTRVLTKAGGVGIGAVGKFQFAATNGARHTFDDILPYAALKPFSGPLSGPAWFTAFLGVSRDGQGSQGPNRETPHSALNNEGIYFENIGGDWWGAGETAQGTTAYLTKAIGGAGNPGAGAAFTLDVSAIWQAWESGRIPNFGFLLKVVAGLYTIYRRNDPSLRGPQLTLNFTDGSSTVLTPAMNSTMWDSLSPGGVYDDTLTVTRIGPNQHTLIYFDHTTIARSKRINSVGGATLGLTVGSLFVNGSFGVFATRWQMQELGMQDTYTGGISDDFTADVGLENHPAVLTVQRFGVDGFGTDVDAYITSHAQSAGWKFISNSANNNPATSPRAIISTTDPLLSQFYPFRSGVGAYRKYIFADGTISGGYDTFFHPYAKYGFNANNQRSNTDSAYNLDPNELWARCYVMPALTILGGGHSGPSLSGRYEVPMPGTDSRTGRPWSSPLRTQLAALGQGAGTKYYWQTEPFVAGDYEANLLKNRVLTPSNWGTGINPVNGADYTPSGGTYSYMPGQHADIPVNIVSFSGTTPNITVNLSGPPVLAGFPEHVAVGTDILSCPDPVNPTAAFTVRSVTGNSMLVQYRSLGANPVVGPAVVRADQELQYGWYWQRARILMKNWRWYCLEIHVVANTFTGNTPNKDGIFEWFVNGRLAQRLTGKIVTQYVGGGITDFFLENFKPDLFSSGGAGGSNFDYCTYTSQIVVATQRIGTGYFT